MEALLRRLLERHSVREISDDLRAAELEHFLRSPYPAVDVEALFGTHLRTRMYVALRALDGHETVGRLDRAVLGHPKNLVLREIEEYAREFKFLTMTRRVVRFNEALFWMPEFLALLDALTALMPEVVEHARDLRRTRAKSKKGTAHSVGQTFRLFGSRVNQATLAYLAANGPSGTTQIMAAANCDVPAVHALVAAEHGMVAVIPARAGNRGDLYSLNAAHPIYAEIRALMRTDAVRAQTWKHRPPPLKDGYVDGSDHRLHMGASVEERFLPYRIFGVETGLKDCVMDVLATLVHTPREETDATSLHHMMRPHQYANVRKALERLARLGVLKRRFRNSIWLCSLNEEWPAYHELREMLLAVGRVWDEYRRAGTEEPYLG